MTGPYECRSRPCDIDGDEPAREPDHPKYEPALVVGRYCRVPELSSYPDWFTRASGFEVRAQATQRGLMKPGTSELLAFEYRCSDDGETFWVGDLRREVEVEIAPPLAEAANDSPILAEATALALIATAQIHEAEGKHALAAEQRRLAGLARGNTAADYAAEVYKQGRDARVGRKLRSGR